jgi:hypothetical protein
MHILNDLSWKFLNFYFNLIDLSVFFLMIRSQQIAKRKCSTVIDFSSHYCNLH